MAEKGPRRKVGKSELLEEIARSVGRPTEEEVERAKELAREKRRQEAREYPLPEDPYADTEAGE